MMKFALLIYESPDAFASRKGDGSNAYTGAWRAYHQALVEAGIFVGGDPLEVPETGTTIKIKDGKRNVQDGPYADTKEQLGGFTILELPSLDAALEWAARCPAASYGAVEVRPLAPETRRNTVTDWPLKTGKANYPMALDEANHRAFVATRKPDQLVDLDPDRAGRVAS